MANLFDSDSDDESEFSGFSPSEIDYDSDVDLPSDALRHEDVSDDGSDDDIPANRWTSIFSDIHV